MSNNTFPLAGQDSGVSNSTIDGTEAGASGDSSSNGGISTGGMIAIIIFVAVATIIGIASSIIFFIAKKNEWKFRESIRKSARKVVNALTPRRSEFPKSVKTGKGPSSRIYPPHSNFDDIPPTPRLKPEDLEKGLQEVKMKKMAKKGGR
ncbi:hypothetical protein BROUX41_000649 [Berkeleyomyces rouxiae]|uniref:uncharacterized protein n=1 Tax=Berkeleyomyces rouxiae TaxID=2035830 RepID=UPI003B78F7DB